jgi:methyl acetate hydrolase
MLNLVDLIDLEEGMGELDQIIHETVERRVAPFLVAAVGDREGLRWHGSAGRASATRDASRETVFRLFSGTKAIGSVMALIAIDRGLLTMDTPVGDILPGFDRLQVLQAITADGPVFRKARTRATLRHLLTHTQGQTYSAWHPLQQEYEERTGAPSDLTGRLESLNYPLLFDPGEGFAYGIGTDWVGHLVSTLDGRPVDQFVREEILRPLGLSNTFFEVDETGGRLADMYLKKDDGSFELIDRSPPSRPELYHMGHALYSTAGDYLRFLRFVLNRGELDGARIISPEAADLMFTDQMRGIKIPTPMLSSAVVFASDVEMLPGTQKTHTASFFMNITSSAGLRSAGSLFWAGYLNTHYWVDVRNNFAGVFFTQILPFCDPDLMQSFERFERAVYAQREAI